MMCPVVNSIQAVNYGSDSVYTYQIKNINIIFSLKNSTYHSASKQNPTYVPTFLNNCALDDTLKLEGVIKYTIIGLSSLPSLPA